MKNIVIQTQVYFLIPVLLLLFPNGLLICWIAAAAIHEMFHILMLWIFRINILSIEICLTGAKIETAPMESCKELIVALAGPVGALSVLVFARQIPQLVICVMAQSLFNLLPVYPLDGGRALRCLCFNIMNQKRYYIFEQCILCIMILAFTLLGIRYRLGVLPMILALALIIKHRNANIPCKDGEHRVQ